MRRLIPLLMFACLFFSSPVVVQSTSTSQPAPQDDSQEPTEEENFPGIPADDTTSGEAPNEDDADKGQGETSWERMNAERQSEVTDSPAEEPPDTFSPLVLWRMIRGLWSKN
jgi:hypothetical protein